MRFTLFSRCSSTQVPLGIMSWCWRKDLSLCFWETSSPLAVILMSPGTFWIEWLPAYYFSLPSPERAKGLRWLFQQWIVQLRLITFLFPVSEDVVSNSDLLRHDDLQYTRSLYRGFPRYRSVCRMIFSRSVVCRVIQNNWSYKCIRMHIKQERKC